MAYLLRRVREEALLDGARVHRRGHFGATRLPLHALGALAQVVPLEGRADLDPARRGEPEALFSARLGLHLGHFAFLGKRLKH